MALPVLLALGCQSLPEGSRAALSPATSGTSAEAASGQPKAIDLGALPALDAIMPQLASKRVVFIGETHDRLDHHLNQLRIIRRLHADHPDLVIAMEYFQQPFQPYLDAYIAGTLDERELLKRTEYFQRWGFDYRLYRPILQYAREHGIALLALNVPQEVRQKVSAAGLDSLSSQERAQIPQDIDRSDGRYRQRLEAIFRQHPTAGGGDFERFIEIQLLWDETMAQRAADYLQEHPGRRMVVLAGSGHIAYGSGIPRRLQRRLPVDAAIVLNDAPAELSADLADFVLLSEEQRLPPAGVLGVRLESADDGLRVDGFTTNSAGLAAGMKAGDRFVAVDGLPIGDVADLKFALLDKRPGDTVQIKLRRGARAEGGRELALNVKLNEGA